MKRLSSDLYMSTRNGSSVQLVRNESDWSLWIDGRLVTTFTKLYTAELALLGVE